MMEPEVKMDVSPIYRATVQTFFQTVNWNNSRSPRRLAGMGQQTKQLPDGSFILAGPMTLSRALSVAAILEVFNWD